MSAFPRSVDCAGHIRTAVEWRLFGKPRLCHRWSKEIIFSQIWKEELNKKHENNILPCFHPFFRLIFPPSPSSHFPSLPSLFLISLPPWPSSHFNPSLLSLSSLFPPYYPFNLLSSHFPPSHLSSLSFPPSHLLSLLSSLPLIFPPSHLPSLLFSLPLIVP